ncbi:MAG: preprotein translocase subunit SecG [Flavobacteriales bacterium]
MVAISIIIIILAVLLALVVLAQNPKGGGLAAGFTGASQIGGVQRTADFMEKATWTLAVSLMVLCLVSASLQGTTVVGGSNLDAPIVLDENPNAGAATVIGDSEAITVPSQEAPE